MQTANWTTIGKKGKSDGKGKKVFTKATNTKVTENTVMKTINQVTEIISEENVTTEPIKIITKESHKPSEKQVIIKTFIEKNREQAELVQNELNKLQESEEYIKMKHSLTNEYYPKIKFSIEKASNNGRKTIYFTFNDNHVVTELCKSDILVNDWLSNISMEESPYIPEGGESFIGLKWKIVNDNKFAVNFYW